MDMKPITPGSPATFLRQRRSLLKPVNRQQHGTNETQQSPLMMGSITMATSLETTSSADNDSISNGDSIDQLLPGVKNHYDSPDIQRNRSISSAGSISMGSSHHARNKHHQATKKKQASTGKNGVSSMSSKISKALFRGERRSMFQGNFSKMDSVATDAHGSKFRRSARSSFNVVEPRSRSMDFEPIIARAPYDEPQVSFDNTSTSSHRLAHASSEKLPPSAPPPIIHNISSLSTGSERSYQHQYQHPGRVKTITIPHKFSSAGSILSERTNSSLNYSASVGSPDTRHLSHQSSLRGTRELSYMDRDEQVFPGCEVVRKPSVLTQQSGSDSDAGISDLVKERLLDRLDQAATTKAPNPPSPSYPKYVVTNSNNNNNSNSRDLNTSNISTANSSTNLNASATSTGSKKIPPLKPPPALPPKAPRKVYPESRGHGQVQQLKEQYNSLGLETSIKEEEEEASISECDPVVTAPDVKATSIATGQMTEESFASEIETETENEANEEPTEAVVSSDELPIKLLERLEASKREDERLMAEHHAQDPPLALPMATDTSFGSSTIASTTSISFRNRQRVVSLSNTSAISNLSSSRKSYSAACSQASKSTAQVTNVRVQTGDHSGLNPYAQFVVDDDDDDDVDDGDKATPTQRQPSQSKSVLSEAVSTQSLIDNEAEDEDLLVEHPVPNAEVVADAATAADATENTAERDDDAEAEERSKLCYLYSQDGEFDNSILSPSQSVHSAATAPVYGDGAASTMSGPSRCHSLPAHSPRLLYRSDAINSFWDQAHCPQDSNLHCIPDEGSCATDPFTAISSGTWTTAKVSPSSGATVSGTTVNSIAADNDDATEAGSIVPDELLNMVTSGCSGVPDPAAKEAINERLVALEAGWSDFRSQVSERMHDLEESWRSWNLNSLLRFSSPEKTQGSTSAAEDASKNAETEDELLLQQDDVDVEDTPTKEPPAATMKSPSTMPIPSSTVITTPPSLLSGPETLPSLSRDPSLKSEPSWNNGNPVLMTPRNPVAAIRSISSKHLSAADQIEVECRLEDDAEEAIDAMIEAVDYKFREGSELSASPEMESGARGVVMSIVQELERSRESPLAVPESNSPTAEPNGSPKPSTHNTSMDLFAEAALQEAQNVELKIMIGSSEHEIPMSLRNTLAEISMIADSNGNIESSNSSSLGLQRVRSKAFPLDSSREDSEGGRVVLDAADWDPVNSSADESIYGQAAAKAAIAAAEERQSNSLPPFAGGSSAASSDHTHDNHSSSSSAKRHGRFFFRRRKTNSQGKKKKLSQQSPKSVMAEI